MKSKSALQLIRKSLNAKLFAMTLLELNDITIVLEKVCAFEYISPPVVPGSNVDATLAKSIKIIMDGGAELSIHGQGTTTAFLRAIRQLSKRKEKS